MWFCAFNPHAGFGLDGWAGPRTTGYEWTRPELWQDMAMALERAKFDLIMLGDSLAVPGTYQGRMDAYLRDNIFAPLGMNDTGFKISDSMRKRLVGMHARAPEGLGPFPFEMEQNPEFHMGGGGLYGTAADYIKFTQMILNKGKGNGNQLLRPETVALMGENNIGAIEVGKLPTALPAFTNDVDLFPGMVKKWGLSFLINTAQTPEGRSAGSLAWAGLANTYFWIDPARNVSGVILMHLLPFADGKCLEAFAGFERGIYAGLGAGSGQKAA